MKNVLGAKMSRRDSRWRMVLAGSVVALMIAIGCKSVPMTGRRQLLLVSTGKEVQLGEDDYREILSNETPSRNQAYIEMVNRVGRIEIDPGHLLETSDKKDTPGIARELKSPLKV